MASPGPTLEPGRVGWGGGPGWNPALKLVVSTDGGAGTPRQAKGAKEGAACPAGLQLLR